MDKHRWLIGVLALFAISTTSDAVVLNKEICFETSRKLCFSASDELCLWKSPASSAVTNDNENSCELNGYLEQVNDNR